MIDVELIFEDADSDSDCETNEDGLSESYFTKIYEAQFSDEKEMLRAFPKQLFCVAHTSSLMCHWILDKPGSFIHALKQEILPLIKHFNSFSIATQQLKVLNGKKLLKIAKTRWHYFYFVCERLLSLKDSIKQKAVEKKTFLLSSNGAMLINASSCCPLLPKQQQLWRMINMRQLHR